MTIEQTGSVVVYVVKGARINSYLQNQYGSDVPVQNGNADIHLKAISIFDAQWTSKFGYPFVNTSLQGKDLSISGSFSCASSQSAERGYGVISNIGSDFIEVKDKKGSNRRLALGACSRLESSQGVPQIGQGFYYQAAAAGANTFNLHAGTCL